MLNLDTFRTKIDWRVIFVGSVCNQHKMEVIWQIIRLLLFVQFSCRIASIPLNFPRCYEPLRVFGQNNRKNHQNYRCLCFANKWYVTTIVAVTKCDVITRSW